MARKLQGSPIAALDIPAIFVDYPIELLLKIQAADIQAGDRIIAYCNAKMQICTVTNILEVNLNSVSLSVFTSERSRNALSRVVRFQRDALIELHTRGPNHEYGPSPAPV